MHEEFNRPNGCTHIKRITRHMHDIVKMMEQPFVIEVLLNEQLYVDIVAYRKKFTARSELDYTTNLPHTILFLLPEGIKDVLRDDYKQMQIGLIYANVPS